jgi:predicted metalloprotease
MRKSAIATLVGATAALAPAIHHDLAARAQDAPAQRNALEGSGPAPMQGPALMAEESGTPPRGQRLRAIVARALDDSIATWKHIIAPRASEIEDVTLRFVTRLGPANCYGLYAGEGPAYCSGNRTVFVGTREANRLMARLGIRGEAGITFLIGHEMGHHIQNIYGRFHLLSKLVARAPRARAYLVRRFELEADCYAGVWIQASPAWASSARFRSDLIEVVSTMGDDSTLVQAGRPQAEGMHGSSAQRTRWFVRGTNSGGDWSACNLFSPQP